MINKSLSTFKQVRFNDEDSILVDTSFLFGLTGSNGNSQIKNECVLLVTKAMESNVPIFYSNINQNEVTDVIIRNEFNHMGYKNQEDIKSLRKKDIKTYNRIHGSGMNSVKNFWHRIEENSAFVKDFIILPDNETFNITIDVMDKFGLFGSNDALQIALATQYGITHFASTDSDFGKVDIEDLTILVDDNTYEKLK